MNVYEQDVYQDYLLALFYTDPSMKEHAFHYRVRSVKIDADSDTVTYVDLFGGENMTPCASKYHIIYLLPYPFDGDPKKKKKNNNKVKIKEICTMKKITITEKQKKILKIAGVATGAVLTTGIGLCFLNKSDLGRSVKQRIVETLIASMVDHNNQKFVCSFAIHKTVPQELKDEFDTILFTWSKKL